MKRKMINDANKLEVKLALLGSIGTMDMEAEHTSLFVIQHRQKLRLRLGKVRRLNAHLKGETLVQVKIKSCSGKGYWYWGMVGEVIRITGEKVVDDGLHERAFVRGKDDNFSLGQISYLTLDRRYLCAKDVEVE